MKIKSEAPSGICLCCRTVSTCTYTKDPRTPVLECEEFEGDEPARLPAAAKAVLRPHDPESGSGGRRKDPGGSRGLCDSCEGREACTFTKPEGGVWHCEEYR